MKQSHIFTKTRREAPKDEVAKNAQLLIRAGYIHKEMAGVYAYLPFGMRVMNKITEIIRQEMNAIDGQEMSMAALQDKHIWEETGRWDDKVVDCWFKTKLKNDTELGLAYTHEPVITAIMKDHINSYRDLPVYAYQFQTKFRNELRAKSGLFRGREFLMKDLYSFTRTQEELDVYYDRAIQAYRNIFDRLGLGDRTYLTLASGGSFGTKYSHEFQTLTSAGEDTIYVNKEKKVAINDEVLNDESLSMLGISKADLVTEKSVEVGNIYKLGTFYSEPLGLNFKNSDGTSSPVIMGSYGIGLGRVMGTIVEVHSDEKGIIWPESVSPFAVHLIALFDADAVVKKAADELYEKLTKKGVEVLYDDRDATAGEKFSDSDLIGIPKRIVLSAKTLKDNSVETKDRRTGKVEMVGIESL